MDGWRWVRWVQTHPRLADALLGLVVGGFSLVFYLTRSHASGPEPHAVAAVAAVVTCLALAWRRSHPIAVLAVVLPLEFATAAAGHGATGWLPLIVAGYSLAGYAPERLVPLLGVVTTVMVAGWITLGWLLQDDVPWQAVVATTVLYDGALLLGDNLRRRRLAAAALLERAERAERERQLLADQRVRQERARLARELHDVVAHSVSLMVIQAAAARRQLPMDPDRADRAMQTVEDTGRQAMTEMRRILGVLRDDSDLHNTSPQPGLNDVPALVASSQLPAQLSTFGDLHGVPAGIELSAYRIVQEAITNVHRHGGTVGHVQVSLDRHGDQLTVEVTDDGRGAGATHAAPGHGLVGMRERVAMLHGELQAGPRAGGGWRVRATIPLAPS